MGAPRSGGNSKAQAHKAAAVCRLVLCLKSLIGVDLRTVAKSPCGAKHTLFAQADPWQTWGLKRPSDVHQVDDSSQVTARRCQEWSRLDLVALLQATVA